MGIHFLLLILVSIAKLCESVEIELQHSHLSVLQGEEAGNDRFLMFNFRFSKLYLAKLIIDIPQPLEKSIDDRCMYLLSFVYFVIEW